MAIRGWSPGVLVLAALLLPAAGCRRTPRRPGAVDGGAPTGARDAGAARADAAPPVDAGQVDAATGHADAEVPGVLLGQPALGPFAMPEALCPALLARLAPDQRDRASCSRDGAPGPAAGPYEELHTWQFEDPDENFERYLMFRLDARWFATLAGSWDTANTSNGDVTVGRASARDVLPGGAPELLFDVVETHSDMDDFDADRFDTVTRRTVCGLGASGQPSCAAVTISGRGENHSDLAERKRYRFQLDCPFQPDGRVTCAVRGKRPADPELLEGLEGTFTLVLP